MVALTAGLKVGLTEVRPVEMKVEPMVEDSVD